MTHGDSPENVSVKSREDLYFIDWDNIIIAPRELDTWNMEWSADYMEVFFPEVLDE